MEAKLQPSRTALIELTGADIPSRGDPGVRTVAGVNWTVEKGDFWVIGGLQGSGKSDLLCVAAGLSRPVAGTCRIFGRELAPSYTDECLSERLRLALVFGEGGRLLSHLPVIENIALPLKYHRGGGPQEIEARVRGLMAAMDLENLGARLPSRLNPSWRQRVALARALAMRPEVLLLDNPTAGLDPRHTRWWTDFVGQLAGGHPVMDNRPMTVAVATDDVRPWRQPGRRFALLSGGRLVLVDDPSELEHPESPIQHQSKADKPQTF